MIITDVDNLSADVVHNVDLDGSAGAAVIPGADLKQLDLPLVKYYIDILWLVNTPPAAW